MKKAGSIALVLAMVCAMLAGVVLTGCAATEEAAADEQLIVYNWGDYIDESIIDSFEVYYAEATGKTIEVVYSMFDTNEIMLTEGRRSFHRDQRSRRGRNGEDERLLRALYVGYPRYPLQYRRRHRSRPRQRLRTPLERCGQREAQRQDTYERQAVLYLKETGRLGSQYASLSIENLINTIDDELLSEVQEVLVEQGEVLSGYEVDFGKADMTSGKAYVDLAWSGDALWAMEDADNLNYFVPEIGGNIWFDGWVMPKTAKNEAAAYMFLDYLCRPDVAMSNSMAIGYTSAVDKEVLRNDEAALAILADNEYDAEEFFADEIRYPEATEKLGVMKDFGAMNEAAVTMWENVKSSNQSLLWILWVVLGVVGAAAIGVAIYFLVVKKKGSRRMVRKAVAKVDDGEDENAGADEEAESDSDKE